jgi:hypothetical protein
LASQRDITALRQPGAPAALDAHAGEYLRHAEQHAADRERKEHRGEIIHGGGIALLDGVEDRAIPDIDAVLKADIGNDQEQQPERKQPRQPVAALAPVAARADPEPRQQIVLAGLLGLSGDHSGSGSTTSGGGGLDVVATFGDDFHEFRFFFGSGALRRSPVSFCGCGFFAGDLTVALPMAAQRQPNQKVPLGRYAGSTRNPARGKCTTTSPVMGSLRRIAMCWDESATISPRTPILP